MIPPPAFAEATIAREGAAGRAWIKVLPDLVKHFLGLWGCTADGPVLHGAVGVVVPIHRDGASGVLKISFPHPGNVAEPLALAAWAGRGAVRVIDRDDAQFAMLLERARQEKLADLPETEETLVVAGTLARRLAVPAPAAVPRLSAAAGLWEQQMIAQDNELDHPLPSRVLTRFPRSTGAAAGGR